MTRSCILVFLLFGILSSCHQRDVTLLHANDVAMGPAQDWDWRTAHIEKDQSFDEYRNSNPVRVRGARRILYLVALGAFTPLQDSVLNSTASYLETFYGVPVRRLPAMDHFRPPKQWRRTGTEGQEQWKTRYLLDSLLPELLPGDAVALMAITATDLYPEDSWNYVFGQATLKDRVGVSSIHRYLDATPDSNSLRRCLYRVIKTTSHEFGHMFSMHHCLYAKCVMNGSNSLSEMDRGTARLCSQCAAKLWWNIGFDMHARLQALDRFFTTYQFSAEQHSNQIDMNLLSP